jgi:drug/metabolite transporter (DMT)-like permease
MGVQPVPPNLHLSYPAGVLLMVAAVAIVIGAVLQVSQYVRGRHIITRGQLVLRLVTAVLLLGIIGMIFFGALFHWPTPLSELAFWSALTLLAVLVILLAASDLRQLERQRHIEQAAIYRAIQDLQDRGPKPEPKEPK